MTPTKEIVAHDAEITDSLITATMVIYGGSFVAALGALWPLADDDNRARLKATFPEYWAQYRELVTLKRAQVATGETRA